MVHGAHLSNDEVPGEEKARGTQHACQGSKHVRQLWDAVHEVVQQLRIARQEAHRVYQCLHKHPSLLNSCLRWLVCSRNLLGELGTALLEPDTPLETGALPVTSFCTCESFTM